MNPEPTSGYLNRRLRTEVEARAERMVRDLREQAAQEANHAALALREVPDADAILNRLVSLKVDIGRAGGAADHLSDAYNELHDAIGDAIGHFAKAVNEVAGS